MTSSLRRDFLTAAAKLRHVVNALTRKIEDLPDNPRIKRLTRNCFVVSSRDLGSNWTPTHHDFKAQYRLIVAAIQRASAGRAFAVLRNIVREQQIKPLRRQPLTLHPDVVAHLTTLIKETK